MGVESSLALMFALFVLAATPGPGVFATTARSLASGFRPACGLVAGIVLGDLFFLLVAMLGMAAIGQILGDLFFIIKICGAAYLVWMGLRLWLKRADDPNPVHVERESKAIRNFIAGFTLTLGNPKVILFYLGFLPAFMDLSHLSGMDVALVVSIVAFVIGGTLMTYALIAARARSLFRNPRAVRILNRGAGTVMIGTGVAIAVKQ